VETALHSFFVSVPHAVALWLLMLFGFAVAVSRMTAPGRTPAAKPATKPAAEPAPEPDGLRHAREAAAAADRAAATAERSRAEWIVAQEAVDAAWQEFAAADHAARQAAKAAAYPLLSRRRKPGENADRQRYLHHAAAAACRRREISIAQLNDVFAHRGWNPRLHPVFQEGALRAAAREHRLAGYRVAVRREQAAWQAAEEAAETLRDLRLAAAAAIAGPGARQPVADEQWGTGQWTTTELPAAA
jgi:hypothetical protein